MTTVVRYTATLVRIMGAVIWVSLLFLAAFALALGLWTFFDHGSDARYVRWAIGQLVVAGICAVAAFYLRLVFLAFGAGCWRDATHMQPKTK